MTWEKRASRCLRVEMARRELKFPALARMMSRNGPAVSAQSLRNKVSRGSFSAAFLLQALTAMECERIQIDVGDEVKVPR